MAKTRFLNRCCYGSEEFNTRCSFNIYQACNGYIYILLGDKRSELTLKQINELAIDVYCLEYFDYGKYKEVYGIE